MSASPVPSPDPVPSELRPHSELEGAGAANLDPISLEPGSHPVATGLGAAGGGLAGAAAGAIAGPVGSLVGAAIGALVGGLSGKGLGELIDPTHEEEYWREAHSDQPYADPNRSVEDYLPAYRAGYEGYAASLRETPNVSDAAGAALAEPPPASADNEPIPDSEAGVRRSFEDSEDELRRGYESYGGTLPWEHVREASRAAWNRVDQLRAEREGFKTPAQVAGL